MYYIVGGSLLFFYVFLFFSLLFVGESGGFLVDLCFFSGGGFQVGLSFLVDWVSCVFFLFICFISGLVFFYSFFYFGSSWLRDRFFWMVLGFVFSMGLLVFGANFFTTMLGWDGLGVTSFFLVVFYQGYNSGVSGLLTVYINRLGDVFFIVAFGWFWFFGSVDWDGMIFGGSFFMFIFCLGCFTKSAQVPFSAWLPAAMSAPTPVSSLVHSSTLVTAGVYVLIRYNLSVFSSGLMVCLSSFTVFLAGSIAVLESDFKKLVAMSTLSQLGVMVYGIVLGIWKLALLHVLVHALFKAALFLSVGSLMSTVDGDQDIRLYGWGWYTISFLVVLSSGLCLVGFPFLVGFYSKDFILWGGVDVNFFSFLCFFVGCIFTVFYVFRMVASLLGGVIKSFSVSFFDFGLSVYLPFFALWGLFVFGGFFVSWGLLGSVGYLFEGVVSVLGLLVLFIGGMLTSFVFFDFGMVRKIGFLSFISGSGLSFFVDKGGFLHESDYSWMEVFGGRGFYLFLSSIGSFVGSMGFVWSVLGSIGILMFSIFFTFC